MPFNESERVIGSDSADKVPVAGQDIGPLPFNDDAGHDGGGDGDDCSGDGATDRVKICFVKRLCPFC